MAQNTSFDLRLPEGHSIQFSQEISYENFIGQFQQYCSKLLCVINGTNLHYYDKTSSLPNNVRFDYKQIRGNVTEYYFRDINDDTLYCVFGREAASIFYPRINVVDPLIIHETNNKSQQVSNTNSTHTIPHPITNFKQEREAHNKSSSNICKQERPPLIQSIKPLIPLFREDHCGIKCEKSSHSVSPYIISTSRITQPVEVTKQISHNKEPEKSRISRKRDQVVIIDNGVKLTFPNPNYPIEIKTYYP